jgi:nickel/cobalt transporter (NiCoT) family protein
MFVLVWIVAVAVWRFGRIEHRWTVTEPLADSSTD